MHADALFDRPWLDLVHPPSVDDDPRVQAAREFKRTVEAESGTSYGWALRFAEETYGRFMDVRDTLDNKAGDIIKYLGGGAGFFTLAVLMNVKPESKHLLAWAIPSFLATLTSLLFAIFARQAGETAFPPSVKAAKDYADHYETENEAIGTFLGQWHHTCEAICVLNDQKANKVNASIWCFFAAISLLILPIFAAILG